MSLLEAIETKNIQKVREEIALCKSNHGILFTALVQACEKGCSEIVSILINAGVDVNIETVFGTPLGQAAFKGHLEVVQRLIEAGADVNYLANAPESKTALILATQEGHFDVVKFLIEAGANVNQVVIESEEFALLLAAVGGHEDIYNYLAPLTEEKLRLLAVKMLVDGMSERQRRLNLDPVCQDLFDEIIKSNYSLDKVKEIIEKGVNVNAFSEFGGTPLLFAVTLNSVTIVRALLEAGANPNLGDDDGDEIPLMRANNEVCSLLIDAGADVNAQRSDCGTTALMIAASCWGGLTKMKILISAGADVNVKDSDGKTALMYALEMPRDIDKVKLLIEAGANVNAVDNTGDTALSLAKKAEENEIIQLLIAAGATEC